MTTKYHIQNSTAGNRTIQAIIASSHIVWIGEGEARVFPDIRR